MQCITVLRMIIKTYSPLRYPGGKSRLVDFMKSIIDDNDLKGGTYIEPFSGGAAIALALAIDGYMSKVIINDYDRSVYAFWYSILNFTDDFIDKIYRIPVTIEEWQRQREIQTNKQEANLLDLGVSTFFLNRTNHSGVLTAGAIGGVGQEGRYKIDARFNKENLIQRVLKIAKYRNKFIVHNEDARDLLCRYRHFPKKNLVYLDPPYFVKGKELYSNFFSVKDHVILSEVVKKRKNMNWLVTYDNHSFIYNLYSESPSMTYALPYCAGAIKHGEEILFYKKGLNITHVPYENSAEEIIEGIL